MGDPDYLQRKKKCNYVYHKWKEKWTALKRCRMTNLFYKRPDHMVGKVVSRLNRTDMTLFRTQQPKLHGQHNHPWIFSSL